MHQQSVIQSYFPESNYLIFCRLVDNSSKAVEALCAPRSDWAISAGDGKYMKNPKRAI